MNTVDNARRLLHDLSKIASLSFVASSNSPEGWEAAGEGSVAAETSNPDQVIFHETGHWRSPQGREFRFRNVFRWTRLGDDLVRLEHLRMGADRPVLLFDLLPDGAARWRSVDGHRCKDDCYTAALTIGEDNIRLEWSIDGPTRRDVISYVYRI